MVRPAAATTGNRLRPGMIGTLFAAPAIVYVVLVIIYPLVYAVWASFTNQRLTSPVWSYVGFDRYASALGNEVFHDSLVVTALFIFFALVTEFVVGFLLALSFWKMEHRRPILRALLLLPVMVTPVAVGLVWKLMLNSDFGVLSHLGEAIGFGGIYWLSEPGLSRMAIVLMDVWHWTPFMFLILLAGLESLPKEPFESAAVDGAPPFWTLRKVTLPMMRRVIAIAVVLRLMFALATFDSVFVLTQGGPSRATDIISLFIYRQGFVNLNISYAAAVSFILLAIVLLVVIGLFRKSLAHELR